MITKILLISAFCCGWKVITSENMLLHPLAQWFVKFVKGPKPDIQSHSSQQQVEWRDRGNWLLKPTFDCVMCFASFWGSIAYWLLTIFVYQNGVNIQTVVAWPIICMAVAAVNGLLYGLICKYEEYMR